MKQLETKLRVKYEVKLRNRIVCELLVYGLEICQVQITRVQYKRRGITIIDHIYSKYIQYT